MRVLLLNGSPHEEGCTHTALQEARKVLEGAGADCEEFWLGNGAVRGCIACGACRNLGQCAFADEKYLEFAEKAARCDALIVGSPVYYAGPNGSLCAFLDRVCFSKGSLLKGKPAAAVVNCRRGGASAAFDRLNKYFTILEMPVASSQYWNSTHGNRPEETLQDEEGLQTVRVLARNLLLLAASLEKAGLPAPEKEPRKVTSFIR